MAEANIDAPVQQRRGVVRNNRLDDQGRNTRQRVDDLETRMDAVEAQGHSHETRLLFLEAHVKVVLRGFTAVQEFLRDLAGDFKLAKSAFIAALVAELKDKAFPEATHCIDEAETLLCENQGVVVVGIFQLVATLVPPRTGSCGFSLLGLVVELPTCCQLRGGTSQKPISVSLIGLVATKATKEPGRVRASQAREKAKARVSLSQSERRLSQTHRADALG